MFHRKPDVPFLLWGKWRKTYTWQGQPTNEVAIIKGDTGYYLEGEVQPRYWLRRVSFDLSTMRVRFSMVTVVRDIFWDTETLTLSADHQTMVGQSRTSGLRVHYERIADPNFVGTSGQ